MPFTRKEFLKLTTAASVASGVLSKVPGAYESGKKLIKPKALKEGDTIALVAPGSPIYSEDEFNRMLSDLEGLGFNLRLGKHVRDQRGYLAGNDKDRAADLMRQFVDPRVDGIICIRGGWGCNRILPLLDFDVMRNHPKVFMGFSDITSLHMAIRKKAGLVTFHGPVGKSTWNQFTTEAFRRVVWKGEKVTFNLPDDVNDAFPIKEGKATGILLGGNLTVLTSMIGSGYLPSFRNAILFLEDVGEDVYRIDRMLTQLKLAGILDQLNGFVFGKCTECEAGDNSLSLQQVFDDHLGSLDIPAFYGAMISHEEQNITLPIGVKAEMDAGSKTISLLEAGVI